jgi:YD repeat-containing protein
VQITDSAGGVLEWSYDAKNLIVSETQNGKKVMYEYNDF